MKTAYKRLNRDHRIEIEKLIAEIKQKLKGNSYIEISEILNRIIFETSQEAIF